MDFLLERARAADMRDVFLEVRPSNPVAIRLYEALGFARVGVRKAYYQASGGREDAGCIASRSARRRRRTPASVECSAQ
jgi:ribosomal-protein-alanine N-acetyltransferase